MPGAVRIERQRHIDDLVLDQALIADFDPQRVKKHDRVDRIERSVLLGGEDRRYVPTDSEIRKREESRRKRFAVQDRVRPRHAVPEPNIPDRRRLLALLPPLLLRVVLVCERGL